jgi:predicted TIM-barrel fold metal-dependent hydrolase
MLEMFPADRLLMFSSDFPHWDGDTPDFAARNFPADLRDPVLHETARALYRLPSHADDSQEAARA